MSAWAAKRFWKAAHAVPCDGGFTVTLDEKPVRSPAKRPLVLPNHAMAVAVAAEWEAQTGKVRPETMPLTRYANSAQEKVAPQMQAVADHLAGYAETDLLCYRATGPAELIARQAQGWDPVLDWLAEAHRAPLVSVQGVMPVPQPPDSLRHLRAAMDGMTAFQLTGFHDLVGLAGSFGLALAAAEGRLGAEAAWELTRIDEIWQAELWGQDEEATAHAAARRAAFLDAHRFWRLSAAD